MHGRITELSPDKYVSQTGGGAEKSLLHTAEREAEIQRRQIEFPGIVECGDKQIDGLAEILFEARRMLVMGNHVVALTALNYAVDIVGEMQNEYRKLEGH